MQLKLFSKILCLALHEKKTMEFSKVLKDFNKISSLASYNQNFVEFKRKHIYSIVLVRIHVLSTRKLSSILCHRWLC